ncbi:DUF1566 domain-containing protein [Desulfurivibrio dismutans]|uniref:Lcl C-terminal domain-containing protein n=1 Tax=Desulfurivibrio dismutans TaxID=1398908 RepID=UPI0023DBC0CB|nr:DUF1566 domain-containing protein [Desulfurivibrio alkaliphilus]MDF1614389.1 DUF1566 domain-containing protein [Desulfurivibrio alkaliphilus]
MDKVDVELGGSHLPPATGQDHCFDGRGREIPCSGSGQDGEMRYGRVWPEPRFAVVGEVVRDLLTGLSWTKNANLHDFPGSWPEALELAAAMNAEKAFGFDDWRLPNRRELLSLLSYQAKKPALPAGHPFDNVFLGWYWTSTSAAINPAYAWYIHLEGARMFYGRKDQDYLFWPVRGRNELLAATGQEACYDQVGRPMECRGSGQDGEFRYGRLSPVPRFAVNAGTVMDRHTGLLWLADADYFQKPMPWQEALDAIARLNQAGLAGRRDWRLPPVNALESLVDCSSHSPALPAGHPFVNLREVYWSATTSFFETDWAWALYLHKGALGVGYKPDTSFAVWPVCLPG